MSKRIFAALMALAMIAAACGDAADADSPVTTVAPVATTTTTVPETTTTVAPETTTTTAAPETTTTTEPGIVTAPVVPGEDSDVDAIVQLFLIVFDNTTTFEEKAPYVTDLSGLEETVEAYKAAGEGVGGLSLEVEAVGIDGDEAKVIYAFLFAGNPTYTGLEGRAVRTDAGWQVTRNFFCDIMTSARVGCP